MCSYQYTSVDECYDEYNCSDCDEKYIKLSNVEYWLEFLLDQLYSYDELDLLGLERCLEELCWIVGMKVPRTTLNVTRLYKSISSIHPIQKQFDCDAWKEFNNNYLKQLV